MVCQRNYMQIKGHIIIFSIIKIIVTDTLHNKRLHPGNVFFYQLRMYLKGIFNKHVLYKIIT